MKLRQLVLGLPLVAGLCVLGTSDASAASSAFKIVPLVSDQPGVAPVTDPDLVNPWGISRATGGPNWVSDNETDRSTVYDRRTGTKLKPVLDIPLGAPTGSVSVPSGTGFYLKVNGSLAPALFLFDTESGAIEGYNPSLKGHSAIIAVDN